MDNMNEMKLVETKGCNSADRIEAERRMAQKHKGEDVIIRYEAAYDRRENRYMNFGDICVYAPVMDGK